METVVFVLMILVCFNFMLKQLIVIKVGAGNIRHLCLVCRADVALCYRAVQNPDCRLAG